MTSEWDGTPWGGTTVLAPERSGPPARAAQVVAKAATGWQSIYNGSNIPRSILARSPLAIMREAQALYWSNTWIGTAEDAVTEKVVGLPWHLEDDDAETVDDEMRDPRLRAIRDLLEKPQAALPEDQRQVGVETWTDLVSLTCRHMGLCGVGYWYPDQPDANGIPTALLYINPARLFPVYVGEGKLVGYVLDPKDDNGRGGTPIARNEVIPFFLKPPDWGALPKGLVERLAAKARITAIADIHTQQLLESGGRLAGLVSPKTGTIEPEDFLSLQRDLMNAAEAPDAAKRLTIVRGPVDYTGTAGAPSDLMLLDIAKMNRDDILAGWNVPPSQAGVAGSASGLNSGETRKYEYQSLMQGPVHARVHRIRQTVQLRLLDRWNALGLNPQLVIEEPEFDDKAAPYEIATKAASLPTTANERRALIALDPLPDYGPDGEPLGLAILLPTMTSTWGQGPEEGASEGNPFPGAPKPEPEPVITVSPPPQLPATVPPKPELVAKAAGLELGSVLDKRIVPALEKAVAAVLRAQRSAIAAKVRARGASLAKKPESVWDERGEDARMTKAIRPHIAGIAQTVTARASEVLGSRAKAEDPFTERVATFLVENAGKRIRGINETTRETIAKLIGEGFDEGLSPAEVADRIEVAATFDEYRAELIARTESARAYQEAAIESFREYGVTEVEAIDGDEDEECAARNGKVYPLDEALAITDHPNGTLDWAPAKAQDPMVMAMKALTVAVGRPTPQPIVNVYPAVTVEPAPITVNLPEQPAPVVNIAPAEVHIETPRTTKTVERDAEGRISRVVEE